MQETQMNAGAERLLTQVKRATANTVFGGSIGSGGGGIPATSIAPTALLEQPTVENESAERKILVEVTTTARGEAQTFQVSIDVPGPGTPVVVGPFILAAEAAR